MEPLFALLFFCAFGVLIGLCAHWLDHARVWPWIGVYVLFGALGALMGGVLLPWLLGFMTFGARTLLAAMLAAAASLVARGLARGE